ncbi:MAG: type II secretion system F family protein [Nocardioides sp.]|nr:type II secretion system F family protein [Nocardioidaceae bacterium]MCB8955330.1 type II secretion system F family protein [Nocardioides sp.]
MSGPGVGTAALVAALCAGLAVWLLVRPRPGIGDRAGVGTRGLVLPSALAVALLLPRLGALVLVVAAAAVGGLALWRRRRRRQDAARVAARVLETCELVAAELAAGRPPGAALERAASAWAVLAPVAEAFRVGADVPDALRSLGDRVDGAGDLRVVAAAWQVAHRTGQGLAAAVERVATGLRSAAATRRLVEGELASARATARLVAGLPVLALLMGSGAGGDPWGFLLRTPGGLACLAGGLAFGLAGLWWIEAIAAEVEARS